MLMYYGANSLSGSCLFCPSLQEEFVSLRYFRPRSGRTYGHLSADHKYALRYLFLVYHPLVYPRLNPGILYSTLEKGQAKMTCPCFVSWHPVTILVYNQPTTNPLRRPRYFTCGLFSRAVFPTGPVICIFFFNAPGRGRGCVRILAKPGNILTAPPATRSEIRLFFPFLTKKQQKT